MTGFAAAQGERAGLGVSVEIKSVNARFLRVTLKAPPLLSSRDVEIEHIVREQIQRGTVGITIVLSAGGRGCEVRVNEQAVRAYQVEFRRLGLAEDAIPLLPGVIGGEANALSEEAWQLVTSTLRKALADLGAMRRREGTALSTAFARGCDTLARLTTAVRERAPGVVREYQAKLSARLSELLPAGHPIDAPLLAREAAVLATRADITEEVDRLDAHVAQVRQLVLQGGAVGRTLEFVAQEMLREASTVAAKSADLEIARCVIAMKTTVEQLREQAANVE